MADPIAPVSVPFTPRVPSAAEQEWYASNEGQEWLRTLTGQRTDEDTETEIRRLSERNRLSYDDAKRVVLTEQAEEHQRNLVPAEQPPAPSLPDVPSIGPLSRGRYSFDAGTYVPAQGSVSVPYTPSYEYDEKVTAPLEAEWRGSRDASASQRKPAAPKPTPGARPAGAPSGDLGGAPAATAVPVELEAGVDIRDVKTPGTYASELYTAIAQGRMSPTEAATKSQRYREWYNTVPGIAARLEGSGIEQKNLENDAALAQAESDARLQQAQVDLQRQAMAEAKDADDQRKAALAAYNATMTQRMADFDAATKKLEEPIDPHAAWAGPTGG